MKVSAKGGSGSTTKSCFVTVNKELSEKEKFIKIADEWVTGPNGFAKATTEYTLDQVTMKTDGKQTTLKSSKYTQSEGERKFLVSDKENPEEADCYVLASSKLNGTHYQNRLKDASDTVTYTFNKDYITYKNTAPGQYELEELAFNKYGYVLCIWMESAPKHEYSYNGEPKEPTYEVTKAEWIKKADELNNAFLESKLAYTSDQFTYKFNNSSIPFTDFKYGTDGSGKRTLSITVASVPMNIADSGYSGTGLDKTGTLDENGTYKIINDEIIYKYDKAPDEYYNEIHINKYGYPTYISYSYNGNDYIYEYIYNGDPAVITDTTPTNYGGYVSYQYGEEGTISANRKYILTSTIADTTVGQHNIPDSIISCDYETESEHFDVQYNKPEAVVNVTKIIYTPTAGESKTLELGTDFTIEDTYDVQKYDYHWIKLNIPTLAVGDKLVIECTVTQKIESKGIWIYAYDNYV